MFYIDGWRPITDFINAVISTTIVHVGKLDTWDEDAEDWEENTESCPDRELDRSVPSDPYGGIRDLNQLRILLPTGATVTASRSLIAGLEGLRAEHVDLLVGTVGSGLFADRLKDQDLLLQKLELERQYGPFLGCPVLINEKEAAGVLQAWFPWHTVGLNVSPDQEASVAKAAADLAKPRRGNPGWHGGLLKRMVHKRFAPLIAQGGYAGKLKKEATRDAVIWLEELTDEEVPMETVEDWLRPLWPDGVGE